MEILPLFIYKEGVVYVGEIRWFWMTKTGCRKYYRLQLELAKEANLPVQIHTPSPLRKRNYTQHGYRARTRLDPYTVIVDHNNEETVKKY